MSRFNAACWVLLPLFALAGCATLEEGQDNGGSTSAAGTGYATSRTDAAISTVQLYRTGNESSLPVLPLGSGETLTLEFDLLEDFGKPLSVYFYHADRNWQRSLLPVEYLRTFTSDDLRDYEPSLGTEVRYTHYTYQFPNANIGFLRSGNYVLRVTEVGREREVLFERAFFLTEQAAEIQFAIQDGLAGGVGGGFLQPVARIRPPSAFDSPIYDYNVCFARNGRFALTRCSAEPTLASGSLFQFFLPRETAFTPEEPLYDLDLALLQTGPQVSTVDFETSPFTVTLDLDYARFGSDLFERDLTGQSLVSSVVEDAAGPADTGSEYVEVLFRYVPQDEQQLAGPVILTGSFNNWVIDPERELVWNAEERWYEGRLLVKQGQYVYKYVTDDPGERERIRRTVGFGQPNLYTAFVYVYDPSFDTDRLLAVSNALGQ
ncbi:MAG: type IX secretion system plug protein domain-containing protein [Bacteroidota bacterium]